MPSIIYNLALANAVTGGLNFDGDSFKVMLCTAGYVPDKDAHSVRSDVTDEVVGTGYTEGGKDVVNNSALDTDNDRVDFVFDGVEWPDATITARYAVYYNDSGVDAGSDLLVMAVDFGSDVASTNGLFSLGSSTLRIQN